MADPASKTTVAAALVVLARRGIPPDVQHLLVHGSLSMGVSPGALAEALDAAQAAEVERQRREERSREFMRREAGYHVD